MVGARPLSKKDCMPLLSYFPAANNSVFLSFYFTRETHKEMENKCMVLRTLLAAGRQAGLL
jgi:hypothetical protein